MKKETRRYSAGYKSALDFRSSSGHQAISAAQLRAIGAIAMAWSEVEAATDRLLSRLLNLPRYIELDVIKRINGLDGKVAILKKCLGEAIKRPDLLKAAIIAVSTAEEYKRYRDAVLHSRITGTNTEFGETIGRRARIDRVTLKTADLTVFVKALDLLWSEIGGIDGIIAFSQPPPYGVDAETKAAIGRSFQDGADRLLESQTARLSLGPPPLPPD